MSWQDIAAVVILHFTGAAILRASIMRGIHGPYGDLALLLWPLSLYAYAIGCLGRWIRQAAERQGE